MSACEAGAADFQPKKTNKGVMDPQTYQYFDYEAGGDDEEITGEKTSSSPPKDPMTIYARLAAKLELKEEQAKVEAQQLPPPQAPQIQHAQATSPTEDRKNARLEEQKEAIAAGTLPNASMSPEELRIEEATRKAKQHSGGLKLFSGNGNLALSLEICRYLGINLGKATVGRFADGEANVVVHENVRGKDCYVIQPTCPPVNDNIMELLLMVSTLRRASARRITVVIPYYGYARQDRKMQVSVSGQTKKVAKVVLARPTAKEVYLLPVLFPFSTSTSRLEFPFRQPTWLD